MAVSHAAEARGIQIIRARTLLFHMCFTALHLLGAVVRVSLHFHSLSLLAQERCDDPVVFGDHDYRQHNVLLEVLVEEGCVRGPLSLLTAQD